MAQILLKKQSFHYVDKSGLNNVKRQNRMLGG